MRRGILFTLMLVIALALVSCGGGEEEPAAPPPETPTEETQAAPPPETISVVMHDIYYGESNDNKDNPPVWTATSGAEVTLNMDNQGALEHNWAIVKPGETVPEPFMVEEHKGILQFDAGLATTGQTASVKFTAPVPGEYTIICTVAGHYPFMQGRLQVN